MSSRLIAASACAVLGLSLAACGGTSSSSSSAAGSTTAAAAASGKKVTLMVGVKGDPFYVSMQCGAKEAAEMRSLLESQRGRIEQRRGEVEENRQLTLGFDNDDLRQLEADKRHWPKRLAALAREMETEPERVRSTYAVKASRIEPAGLIYLWPVSG